MALAVELAAELPADDARAIAQALAVGRASVLDLRHRSGSARLREAITALLEASPDDAFLAGALAAAALATERSRQVQPDIVWTGPPSRVASGRLTSAVVAELLRDAQREVLILGYAVQETARVSEALREAAARGVSITLLLEQVEDNPGFRQNGDPLPDVPARRLRWPREQREAHAALHAKVLVVDRRAVLVGSANLTGAAMERNIECGVLLRGGVHAELVHRHVESLLEAGVLAIGTAAS